MKVIGTTVPATKDSTVMYYDANTAEQVMHLQERLDSLEEDFSKLLIMVQDLQRK
jgi:uncharacterized protein with PhoU and TrkA domain